MLSSGGYYYYPETFLHRGGNMKELLLIAPREISKTECGQRSSGYMKCGFGADVFFKMSHEVYNYGEGLVGKMAADNSHKWVYSDNHNECEPSYVASWNATVDNQRRGSFRTNQGIQSIVVISVREGVVQLGSFNKIAEDVNLVINIQRKFRYLQSIPGVFAIQRPYLPIQHPYTVKPSFQMMESNGINKQLDEKSNRSSMVAIDMGWNSPHIGTTGPPPFSIMSSSLGSFFYQNYPL